ncbi:MAG: hypothetical protein JSS66_05195 [Armatimonadetes bacterium]|nr:hypothetical protein [Armatimonadota bacterium]
MPAPIGLVSQQSLWDTAQGHDDFSLSDIQRELLEMGGQPTREAAKVDPQLMGSLERIMRNEADDLTALADAVGQPKHMYRVPTNVSDYELLSLKTAGMVMGYGRAVHITDKGKEALRMQWLNSSNKHKDLKTSDYEHPWSKTAGTDQNVRTASKKKQFACDERPLRKFGASNRRFASEE